MRDTINIPHPTDRPLRLVLEVGACKLTLAKGSGTNFVSGYYNDPSDERPCNIDVSGGTVRFWQKHLLAISGRHMNHPEFVLEVSDTVPFEFELKSGASEVFVDLGGLPVEKAMIRFNAGKATIDFSKPNPVEMKYIDFSGNAGELNLSGIANSNAEKVHIEGSAAGFNLNFSGTLKRNMTAQINSSVSGINVEFPRDLGVKVRANAVLGGINGPKTHFTHTSDGWVSAPFNPDQPNLTFDASVTLGGIDIRLI